MRTLLTHCVRLLCVCLFLSVTAVSAHDLNHGAQGDAVSKVAQPNVVNIWPQIPFVRGKDLCQYHDAFGRTKSEQMAELTARFTTVEADYQAIMAERQQEVRG